MKRYFCNALTFRDNKHRNVGDVTKICLDGLLWTWNFSENVLRHFKETYYWHETYRICMRKRNFKIPIELTIRCLQ